MSFRNFIIRTEPAGLEETINSTAFDDGGIDNVKVAGANWTNTVAQNGSDSNQYDFTLANNIADGQTGAVRDVLSLEAGVQTSLWH